MEKVDKLQSANESEIISVAEEASDWAHLQI